MIYYQIKINKVYCFLLLALFLTLGSSLSAYSSTYSVKDSALTVAQFLGKDFKKVDGVLPFYSKGDRHYMFVADTIIGRDILQVVSLNKGSARMAGDQTERFGYGGDIVFEQSFRFAVLNAKSIGITRPTYFVAKDSTVVPSSYTTPPVAYAFDVVCKTSAGFLIEITNLLYSDSEYFSLKGATDPLRLGAYLRDRSFLTETVGLPDRMIFRSLRTYAPANKASSNPKNPNAQPPAETSWEIGSCWYVLPQDMMRRRYNDSRVGYFTGDFADFDNDKAALNTRKLVRKWNMQPKAEDREAYLAGKLVEPQRPIVFYVDKNFPEAMVPYIMEGVNAWQKSFEKAGFKNAIYALREQDFADGDFPWDDVRYSAISLKAVTIPNAYGPMVIDPRSGEIISAHVAIFHNIFDILQRWYFALCAPLDARAQKLPFSDELMGGLIRNAITHEVGHSLGLRHNFAASTHYLSDSLRNVDFVKKHGIGLSIMDYLRYNHIVQPSDNMPAELLLNAIGDYDHFAINWGYRYLGESVDGQQEENMLDAWVSQQLLNDPRLRYIEENIKGDPSSQQEDIGKDVIKSSGLAVENLKRSMKLIADLDDQENYMYTRQMYTTVLNKYQLFVGHVASFIGGKYTGVNRKDVTDPVLVPIDLEDQKEAMDWLKANFIKPQDWLYPVEIQSRSRFYLDGNISPWIRDFVSVLLVKPTLLIRNLNASSAASLEVKDYLSFLTDSFFDASMLNEPANDYTQLLQNEYVNRMISLTANVANVSGDTALHMSQNLSVIRNYAKQAALQTDSLAVKTHYQGIIQIIDAWMGI